MHPQSRCCLEEDGQPGVRQSSTLRHSFLLFLRVVEVNLQAKIAFISEGNSLHFSQFTGGRNTVLRVWSYGSNRWRDRAFSGTTPNSMPWISLSRSGRVYGGAMVVTLPPLVLYSTTFWIPSHSCQVLWAWGANHIHELILKASCGATGGQGGRALDRSRG